MIPAQQAWLGAPWAGALLRLLADPAEGMDPAIQPSAWPAGLPLEAALAHPQARGRLARLLLPEPAAAPAITACAGQPAARLALVPTAEMLPVIARAAGWLQAPTLARLLRREDVASARAALGDTVFDWALRSAPLLPRPASALEALAQAGPPGILPGAALLGMAMGDLPAGLLDRLRLRAPAPVWAEVARHAAAGATPPGARADALAALRRLLREEPHPWSDWLN